MFPTHSWIPSGPMSAWGRVLAARGQIKKYWQLQSVVRSRYLNTCEIAKESFKTQRQCQNQPRDVQRRNSASDGELHAQMMFADAASAVSITMMYWTALSEPARRFTGQAVASCTADGLDRRSRILGTIWPLDLAQKHQHNYTERGGD